MYSDWHNYFSGHGKFDENVYNTSHVISTLATLECRNIIQHNREGRIVLFPLLGQHTQVQLVLKTFTNCFIVLQTLLL